MPLSRRSSWPPVTASRRANAPRRSLRDFVSSPRRLIIATSSPEVGRLGGSGNGPSAPAPPDERLLNLVTDLRAAARRERLQTIAAAIFSAAAGALLAFGHLDLRWNGAVWLLLGLGLFLTIRYGRDAAEAELLATLLSGLEGPTAQTVINILALKWKPRRR